MEKNEKSLETVISFRLKKTDMEKLKEEAKKENRTISNYIKTKLKLQC